MVASAVRCTARRSGRCEATCSLKRSSPPGRTTRCSSATAAARSLTEQRTKHATAASTLASPSGRSSAAASPTETGIAELSAVLMARARRYLCHRVKARSNHQRWPSRVRALWPDRDWLFIRQCIRCTNAWPQPRWSRRRGTLVDRDAKEPCGQPSAAIERLDPVRPGWRAARPRATLRGSWPFVMAGRYPGDVRRRAFGLPFAVSVYGPQFMRSSIPLFNVTVVGGGPVTSK